MVHTLDHNEPAAAVNDRDNAAPVIALGLGRLRHLAAARLSTFFSSSGTFFLGQLRSHNLPNENDCCNCYSKRDRNAHYNPPVDISVAAGRSQQG
jgi:hypothetical protein